MSPSLQDKEKARFARIKRVYGLTKEQYYQLNTGFCPICLRDWSDTVRPCIDHDHVSQEVRGLLCTYCNHRVVGKHRNVELLRRVVDYLSSEKRGWIIPPKKKRKKRPNKNGPRSKRTK